jgi:hypothetical protein
VRVIEEDVANRPKIARMVNRAAAYLRRQDPSRPYASRRKRWS